MNGRTCSSGDTATSIAPGSPATLPSVPTSASALPASARAHADHHRAVEVVGSEQVAAVVGQRFTERLSGQVTDLPRQRRRGERPIRNTPTRFLGQRDKGPAPVGGGHAPNGVRAGLDRRGHPGQFRRRARAAALHPGTRALPPPAPGSHGRVTGSCDPLPGAGRGAGGNGGCTWPRQQPPRKRLGLTAPRVGREPAARPPTPRAGPPLPPSPTPPAGGTC